MYGNFFYKNNDGKFSPAELAMVKFTFRDGIIKKHHTFINPGDLIHFFQHWSAYYFDSEKNLGCVELGYAYTAKAHSERTHRLPPPPNAYGETNLGRVWYEMKKFMKDHPKGYDGGNPIVFVYADPYASEDNEIEVLKSFMNQIAGNESASIDIYPLTRLFYALQKELVARGRGDDIPNENFCNVFLSRDPYETIAGISCQVNFDRFPLKILTFY